MNFNGKFWHKPGHLGMTTDEVKTALTNALTPVTLEADIILESTYSIGTITSNGAVAASGFTFHKGDYNKILEKVNNREPISFALFIKNETGGSTLKLHPVYFGFATNISGTGVDSLLLTFFVPKQASGGSIDGYFISLVLTSSNTITLLNITQYSGSGYYKYLSGTISLTT